MFLVYKPDYNTKIKVHSSHIGLHSLPHDTAKTLPFCNFIVRRQRKVNLCMLCNVCPISIGMFADAMNKLYIQDFWDKTQE